ncbi:hypothetical protein B0H67DRAFT_582487 [Lasiosphaeris hirsuta]|uniref:Ankyrin repeat protein n=1 Tax=Lasiosphaeris hirsuta TaxID=260670 RepID=A0AA40AHY2_9PEZI|nr:hypothetical protein B0H67DRAFT_582487 [Lasiosphaeris hirsuta]
MSTLESALSRISLLSPSPTSVPISLSRSLGPHLASLTAGRKADGIHSRLSLFMPENESKEHLIRAESICQHGTQWAARTWLELALFCYSNHLDSPSLDAEEGGRRYGTAWATRDKQALQFLDFLWTAGTVLQELVQSEAPTAQALVERFFASAVRLGRIETLRKLVDDAGLRLAGSGLLVGVKDRDDLGEGTLAPIDYALRVGDAEMVDFLLENGAKFTTGPARSSLDVAMAGYAVGTLKLEVADDSKSPRSLADEVWVDQGDRYSEEELIRMLSRMPRVRQRPKNLERTSWPVAARRILKRLGRMDTDFETRLQNPLPLLIFAIRYGDREMMAAVTSRVPDLDATWTPDGDALTTTAMAEAAWVGDLELCRILMARGATPNPAAASSLSALQIAAHLGNMPLAGFLVEKGADVNYSFSGSVEIRPEPTALGLAIAEGHAPMVEFLLAKGAIATAENLVSLEPLLPELPDCEAMVRRLVSSQGEDFTSTALLVAVRQGDLNLAKLLVRAGADWSHVSETGETPLALALSVGYASVVHHIVETGLTRYDAAALLAATAATDSAVPRSIFNIILDSRCGVGRYHYHQSDKAWTAFLEGLALATAVCLGDEHRVARLLDAGISPVEKYPLAKSRNGYLFRFNLRDDGTNEVLGVGPESRHDHILTIPGATILGTACGAKQSATVPILLRHGYQPTHVDLAIAAHFMDQKTVDLFLPLVPNHSGILSPLIRRGWTSHVDKILDNGGDPNTLETYIPAIGPYLSFITTPLKSAILSDNIKLVSRLLHLGAHRDICPGPSPSSPLAAAAAKGHIAIVKLLISHGAGINASCGESPLEAAAQSGRIDVLKYLLSEGADTEGVHRRRYLRAIKLAEEEGHQLVVRMLKEHREWSEEDGRIFEALDVYDEDYGDGWGGEKGEETGREREDAWQAGLDGDGGEEGWQSFVDWDDDKWGSLEHDFSFQAG